MNHLTRNGKIARLPSAIREELNRRLEDGWPGTKLVAWLNTLPEVQAAITADWHGRPIRPQNLSEWRHGGFRDWQARQETMAIAVQLGRDARESIPQPEGPSSPSDAQPPLTDTLALWLTARYAVAGQQMIEAGDRKPETWRSLREFCHDLVRLRRGDHSAERLRLNRARLKFAAAGRDGKRTSETAEGHAPASSPHRKRLSPRIDPGKSDRIRLDPTDKFPARRHHHEIDGTIPNRTFPYDPKNRMAGACAPAIESFRQ